MKTEKSAAFVLFERNHSPKARCQNDTIENIKTKLLKKSGRAWKSVEKQVITDKLLRIFLLLDSFFA
jgi:hypothetical protein